MSTRHGGPEDRGSADRYYHRRYSPHYYKGDTGTERVPKENMTEEEISQYRKGWDEEDERKDYIMEVYEHEDSDHDV